MISRIREKGLGGEKLVDFEFVRALLNRGSFRHHLFLITHSNALYVLEIKIELISTGPR